MCYDGRLQARQVANIMHAVGKMSAAGKLATDDVDIQDTLVSLGRAVQVEARVCKYGFSRTSFTLGL
jgi:hypothetical protein